MEEKLLQQILEELQKGGSSGGQIKWNSADLDTFAKGLKDNIDALKKAQPGYKSFQNFLDGTKTAKDSFDSIREKLEKFDEELEKATKATLESADAEGKADAVQKVSAINAQKRELASATAAKASKAALGNLAIGAGEVMASMSQGAMDFISGLQSGADSTVLATNAAKNLAGAALKTTSEVAGMGQTLGMMISFVPGLKLLGMAIEAVSFVVDIFAKKGIKVAEAAVQALGTELQKTKKGFNDINSAGALFGGGMTEMRKEASRAGLDIESLATVVKASKDDLIGMGLGMGEATKRVAGVSKELRNSELGMQLRKLGYTAEEQAELSAGVMANMNAAGNQRVMSDKELAQTTSQYGKDLKILADVTGQDAKKVAEKARIDSLKAVLDAKLTGEQRETYQGILRGIANYPADIQEAVLQKVAGGPVTNVAAILAMQANKQLGDSVDLYAKTVKDGTMSGSQAQQLALDETGKIGKAQHDANVKNQSMLEAGLYVHSDIIDGQTKIANAFTSMAATQKDGAAQIAKTNADLAATNMAPLDASVAGMQENADKLRSALGDKLLKPVTKFAETAAAGAEKLEDALKRYGVDTKSSKQEQNEAAAKAGNRGRGATPAGATAPSGTPPSSGAAGGESKGTAPTAGSVPAPAPSAPSGRGSGMGGGTSRMKTGSLADGLTSKKTTTAAEGSGGADNTLPSGTGGADWLMGMIKNHEGMKLEPYKDSLGKWTVGVGHLIGDGSTLPDAWNKKFSESEVMDLFKKDFDVHQAAASLIPGFSKLGEKAQGALTDMTFNMGPSWYKSWPNLMKSLGGGDIDGAVANLASSKWASQVGKRSTDDINLLKDNKVQAKEGGFADGPDSGYQATLHGKEAIVPLSGSKSVPVTMDLSTLIHKFDEMIKVLKAQQSTSEKILRVSA